MIVISVLSGLTKAEVKLIDEYLAIRDSGFDQDTAYSFMDGRHKSAIKAMRHLSEEYNKQERAMKPQKRPKPSR